MPPTEARRRRTSSARPASAPHRRLALNDEALQDLQRLGEHAPLAHREDGDEAVDGRRAEVEDGARGVGGVEELLEGGEGAVEHLQVDPAELRLGDHLRHHVEQRRRPVGADKVAHIHRPAAERRAARGGPWSGARICMDAMSGCSEPDDAGEAIATSAAAAAAGAGPASASPRR